MKNLKKVLIVVFCLLMLAFLLLTYNYVRTGKAIKHYYMDTMRVEDLSDLAFVVPYINHYNRGVSYYSERRYDMAEEEFRKALSKKHPMDEEKAKDCNIRINLALSMVKPLTPESITSDNVDIALQILYEARDILCEEGCADMENKEWHNDDAQTLKEEIDEYIKLLEDAKNNPPQSDDGSDGNGSGGGSDQNQNQGDGGSNQNQDNNDQNQGNNDQDQGGDDQNQNGGDDQNQDGGDDQNQDDGQGQGDDQQDQGGQGEQNKDPYQDILDELDDLQHQGTQERQGSLENADGMGNYSYYGGKSW